jgi:hypothetical protein
MHGKQMDEQAKVSKLLGEWMLIEGRKEDEC